jgi:hypothetical protein
MITLFLLSYIIGGAQGAMQYQAEPVELEQFNIDGLFATFKWSDGSKTDVKMFPASLEDCIYSGSFPEDPGSSILG